MRKLITLITAALVLSSCGGGGGGTEAGCDDLGNSCVYVSLEPQTIDADILVKQDIDGDNICDTASFSPFGINIRITVVPINPEAPTSPVELRDYTVSFQPLFQNYPVLPPRQKTLGVLIQPNQELTTSIEILNQNDAIYLANSGALASAFEYNVIIKLHFVEIISGEETTLTRYIYIKAGDFVDNCVVNQ
ncbi:hypothetical protein [Aquifex sp.]